MDRNNTGYLDMGHLYNYVSYIDTTNPLYKVTYHCRADPEFLLTDAKRRIKKEIVTIATGERKMCFPKRGGHGTSKMVFAATSLAVVEAYDYMND